MSRLIIQNNKFLPIEQIDLTKAGNYFIRKNSKDPRCSWANQCISRLEVTDQTCINGFWVFINGHSSVFNLFKAGYEFCGPFSIDESA